MRLPSHLRSVTPASDPWGPQETDDPIEADKRAFFKVEEWTKDDNHIKRMIHAGNRIETARQIFDAAVKKRPGGRYTIRQGIRVLAKWPEQ